MEIKSSYLFNRNRTMVEKHSSQSRILFRRVPVAVLMMMIMVLLMMVKQTDAKIRGRSLKKGEEQIDAVVGVMGGGGKDKEDKNAGIDGRTDVGIDGVVDVGKGQKKNDKKGNLEQRLDDPCSLVNPCINGDCSATVDGTGFVCSCFPGYVGSACEFPDPCLESPCGTSEGSSCDSMTRTDG
jgi:hypothetical protein